METAIAIDKDCWLHTGDVGQIFPNGTLRIIDRKKHIFKLSQGEYIAPEKLENIFTQCPQISEIFIDGNSFYSYLIAIIFPDKDELRKLGDKMGLT